jgi:hypothetical protein
MVSRDYTFDETLSWAKQENVKKSDKDQEKKSKVNSKYLIIGLVVSFIVFIVWWIWSSCGSDESTIDTIQKEGNSIKAISPSGSKPTKKTAKQVKPAVASPCKEAE